MPSSRTSKRKRKAIEIADNGSDDEEEDTVPQVKEEDQDESAIAGPSSSDQPLFRPDLLDEEDEDEKPEGKPKLRVSYDGFSIFGK